MLARLGMVGALLIRQGTTINKVGRNFERLRREGDLLQRFNVMGDDSLDSGYLKILLDGDRLPPLEDLRAADKRGEDKGSKCCFHCVSHQLVFALLLLLMRLSLKRALTVSNTARSLATRWL